MSTPTDDPEVVYADRPWSGGYSCTADVRCRRKDAVAVRRSDSMWLGAAVCPDHDTSEGRRSAVRLA